jgi:hypothetical protein
MRVAGFFIGRAANAEICANAHAYLGPPFLYSARN